MGRLIVTITQDVTGWFPETMPDDEILGRLIDSDCERFLDGADWNLERQADEIDESLMRETVGRAS